MSPEAVHGTRARYQCGCRCDPCRGEAARYARDKRAAARAAARALSSSTARTGDRCPGVGSEPCPRGRRLEKRSVAGLCKDCVARLAADPLVPADVARRHLLALARAGIGRRAVSDACDVAPNLLRQLRLGMRPRLRASTERRILAVDAGAAADRALVDARPTWSAVRRLVDVHGFTSAGIAQRVGLSSRALRSARQHVTARTAHRIARLLADAEGEFLA